MANILLPLYAYPIHKTIKKWIEWRKKCLCRIEFALLLVPNFLPERDNFFILFQFLMVIIVELIILKAYHLFQCCFINRKSAFKKCYYETF